MRPVKAPSPPRANDPPLPSTTYAHGNMVDPPTSPTALNRGLGWAIVVSAAGTLADLKEFSTPPIPAHLFVASEITEGRGQRPRYPPTPSYWNYTPAWCVVSSPVGFLS